MIPIPLAELGRVILGTILGDLLRWLWSADDAHHPRTFQTYCAWCGLIYVTQAAEPPVDDTAPPGWHAAPGVGVWCGLRCWVEHWRADRRIPPPPVTEAGADAPDNPGD